MDRRSHGLLQLAGSEDAVVEIVFVHGLTGDRESSWTSKNNTFWPKTLLPEAISNARILTWGYHHGIFFNRDEIAENLCRDLMATRIHKHDCPIIFVGHDFGAVICANQVVSEVSSFLGMPQGSEGLRLRHPNLPPETMAHEGIFEFIKLKGYALDLSEGQLRDMLRSREWINTFDFYEQDDSDFFGRLLKTRRRPPGNSYERLLIPGNHVTMCQFDSSDEPGYIMLKWLLQKWIKEIPKHASGGPADPAEASIATDVPALDAPAELHILHRLIGLSNEDDNGTFEDSEGLTKPLLLPETVRWLASKELLSSIQQESLTISTAPLLESFTSYTPDPSSTGGKWSLSEDDKPFIRQVDIPIHLNTAKIYEFLGYQRNIAEHLWTIGNSSLNSSYSWFEVSREYLQENLPTEPEYNWNKFMDNIGICDRLRNSILDSHFYDIRSAASCEFWLRTAFEIRWQELKALNENLLQVMKRTASSGEHRTGPSAPSHDRGTNTKHRQSSGHQDTVKQLAEQRSGQKEEQESVAATIAATKTTNPENGVVILWRGGSKASIENANNNGQLRLNKIRSVPGDFSGTMRVPYFTAQRKTAERYGVFHATLSQICIPPYLLKFQLSKNWLQDLQHRCLWATGRGFSAYDIGMPSCPDQEVQGETEDMESHSWERVVFTCRRGGFTPNFLRRCDLLIGHIAKFHDEDIVEMESETGIRDGLLLIDDMPAVQYAFVSESSQEELVTRASGVETERLRGESVRIYRDDHEGRTGVEDVRYLPPGGLMSRLQGQIGQWITSIRQTEENRSFP